jgi:hypothetical protein
MRRASGITLIVVSALFAAIMAMRAIGRFLIFLVVDRPEVGAGFLLWTFVSTAIALYLAWQLGSKGADLLASTGRRAIEDRHEEVRKKTQE